ncbi:MAG: PIN domain-containing protein [Verrucomicrobiales bacterium]|nr:PIN domain-containing protein [Verrucomicrobiales bacterium]HQW29478.1 PIN domain-containing protein [Verrucomicrobiales bacterium]
MIHHYPDTSFLCSSYRKQEHTPEALAYRRVMDGPLYFTSLLEFEFRQAIELQVWLHSKDKTRGYTRKEADRMIADWESDVASGLNRLLPFDMDAVLRLSLVYSNQRTAHGGHRTLDIFHVATAIHLQATHFLTFDARQRDLARHAGLELPV